MNSKGIAPKISLKGKKEPAQEAVTASRFKKGHRGGKRDTSLLLKKSPDAVKSTNKPECDIKPIFSDMHSKTLLTVCHVLPHYFLDASESF